MAGNFGIGLGAFMQGFTQGATAAQGIKRADSQQKLVDMQIEDLQNNRQATQQAKDIAASGVTDAQKNTDGQIDNVLNYYRQNTVPKLQQFWISQGDPAKATAFGKWAEDANVQQGMRYSAGMLRAAQLGDPQGVMDNLVKAYNQPGYFEDGMSAVKASLRTDKDGNAAGMDIVLKNNKTGEETTHTFNSMKDVYQTAMLFGQPDQVFKYGMEQIQAGDKAAVEMAKENRDFQRDNVKAERDQNYRLEAQNNQAQLTMARDANKSKNPNANKKVQDAQATIAFLKENGATDDYIRSNLPGILGLQNRNRPASSRIDDYIKMRSDNDRQFRSKSLDDQIKEAQSYIAAVDKQTGEGAGITLGTTPAVPQNAQTNGQQPQQGGGVLFLDTKTGQIISR